MRLLEMALEIPEKKTLIVKRPNKDYLLSIRSGSEDYDNLLEELPESICNMIWLEELYLSGNKLKKLPKNIIKLKNIKWLFIIDKDNLVLTKQQEKWIENIKSKGNKVL